MLAARYWGPHERQLVGAGACWPRAVLPLVACPLLTWCLGPGAVWLFVLRFGRVALASVRVCVAHPWHPSRPQIWSRHRARARSLVESLLSARRPANDWRRVSPAPACRPPGRRRPVRACARPDDGPAGRGAGRQVRARRHLPARATRYLASAGPSRARPAPRAAPPAPRPLGHRARPSWPGSRARAPVWPAAFQQAMPEEVCRIGQPAGWRNGRPLARRPRSALERTPLASANNNNKSPVGDPHAPGRAKQEESERVCLTSLPSFHCLSQLVSK